MSTITCYEIVGKITLNANGEVVIPDDTTKEEWFEAYRKMLHLKRYNRAWIKKMETWAVDKFGLNYVQGAYEQVEIEFGDPKLDVRPDINPQDKSKAIVTIQGVAHQFSMWSRKMESEIPKWDAPRLKEALTLLEPIEKQAQQMRALLSKIV